MPSEASSLSDFTKSGNSISGGRRSFFPRRSTQKAGTRTPWCARTIFESALSRARVSPRGLQPV
jgi:hypothetical protein